MSEKIKTILIALVVLFVAGFAIISLDVSRDAAEEVSQQTETKRSSKNTPEKDSFGEIKKTYMEECSPQGRQEEYCECAYDFLIDNYGKDGFIKVGLELERTGEFPEEMINAVTSCIDKYNY